MMLHPKKPFVIVLRCLLLKKRRGWKESHAFVNEHKGYRPKLALLAEIIGNPLVDEITKTDIAIFNSKEYARVTQSNAECDKVSPK